MNENSQILQNLLGILFPFIILFGLYVTLNGHHSPGGGFQGGAVLASLFICKYIVLPSEDFNYKYFNKLEKLTYIFILLLPTLFIVTGLSISFPNLNIPYLIIMNALIAFKVFLGLSIIFIRFVFYESR